MTTKPIREFNLKQAPRELKKREQERYKPKESTQVHCFKPVVFMGSKTRADKK